MNLVKLPIWLPNGEGKSSIIVNLAHVYLVREYRGRVKLLLGVIEYDVALSLEETLSVLEGDEALDVRLDDLIEDIDHLTDEEIAARVRSLAR